MNKATNQPFDVFYGREFTHIKSSQKSGVTMCPEHFVKDRKSSDMPESYNLAIGAHNELKMLVGGITCASAFFATFLAARPKLLEAHYERVASLIQQRCGLSLLHMRDVGVSYTGSLKFVSKKGKILNANVDEPEGLENATQILIDDV